ncbi:MAG: phosphoribosylformylglycinamidine synthase subunit PurS [Candidatus Caldatribacteriota bacterium]|jgi:phosphoribosylformylglycinamidine synthase PurS subunit|nr:phosphoribosylformylglycinamidine synthase subunit PurS [Atribacterota bacterium]MDD3640264.1 phosphoribosylformylglycinamidine synthase subunit PurS [Atribacterota bacterium]MDD4288971.1 phosphoribosylformylglycinamidine synthase subunit PurS [Atribacterota bacterium]MDD4765353.1 phosphoribosylformylglycinamidine synthase subunit PurS [Atribacterota bacterium]MDD5635678.1 phosphoribosylformylglycinamidine synthase subunit PurS [Atribacterota bacterium]
MWSVEINIKLKKGVLDTQGKAIHNALLSLGFSSIKDVRIGKLIEIQLEGNSQDEVSKSVQDMCQKLLANPVIEDYSYKIEEQ